MIVGSGAPCAADILIHITHLHVELFAHPVTCRHIRAILIKHLSIDSRRISNVEEYLVLNSRKPTLRKTSRTSTSGLRTERHDPAEEIAEPVCVAMPIMDQLTVFRVMCGQIALLDPQSMAQSSRRMMTCNPMIASKLHRMRIDQLLPDPVFRQISFYTPIDALLMNKSIACRTRQPGGKIEVDTGPEQ